MKKNKQVDIIQIIPNLALGGAEIVLENLVKELIKRNKNVLVISLYSERTVISRRIEEVGIPVIYLDKKSGFDISMFLKLFKLLKTFRPNIIHSHLSATLYSVPSSMLANLHNRVHTIHSIADKEGNKIIRFFYKIYYKLCNLIPVAISTEVEKSFYKVYGNREESIPLIYNGIDLQKYSKKKSYEIEFENINITHIGSFKEPKNHKMIVQSFCEVVKKYPGAKLNLIGNGEMLEIIKEQVKKLNLVEEINFIGEVEEVSTYLSEADVFILPSLWEGMPISLIEAMASGLPIISTNVGGIPDMVTDNYSGILIGVDEIQLTNALLDIISDKELREKVSTNAYIKSLEFSSENMTSGYEKLYKSIGEK